MDVRSSYDSAARAYADHLASELDAKPLDRHLLDRFAEELRGRGRAVDLGCGPGHITRYLAARDVDLFGLDLSPAMIAEARRLHPGLEFRVGDMLALDLPADSIAGIVSFYSIVHFNDAEFSLFLAECRRILAPDGVLLLAFHVGDSTHHVDDLWGSPVSLDFRFFLPSFVAESLFLSGFLVTESSERDPYPDVEYPSRRCYLFARRGRAKDES